MGVHSVMTRDIRYNQTEAKYFHLNAAIRLKSLCIPHVNTKQYVSQTKSSKGHHSGRWGLELCVLEPSKTPTKSVFTFDMKHLMNHCQHWAPPLVFNTKWLTEI